jgi:hypothetical protein
LKKALKTIGVTGILILYCFAISIYSGVAVDTTKAFSKPSSTEKAAYKAVISSNSFSHTAPTEIAVGVGSAFRPASLKNNTHSFSTLAKTTEQLFSATFSQYKYSSKNWHPGIKKAALIFPFHYFW